MAAIPSPDRFSSNLVEPLQARALRGLAARQACRAARNAASGSTAVSSAAVTLTASGPNGSNRNPREPRSSSKAHNSGSRFSGKIAVTGLSRVAGAASGFSRSLL
jgi:hypothetical protein